MDKGVSCARSCAETAGGNADAGFRAACRTDEDIARMREWVEMCRWNKDGQGDRTGLLPDPALKMISQSSGSPSCGAPALD